MAEYYSSVHIYHIWFICDFVDVHWSFHLLAIVNNAAVNIVVHIVFESPVSVFVNIHLELEWVCHRVVLCLTC